MGWQVHKNADWWLRYWPLCILLPVVWWLPVTAFSDCFQSKRKARRILRLDSTGASKNEILSVLSGFQFTYDDEARELRKQLIQLAASKQKYKLCQCPNCGRTLDVPLEGCASEYECNDCQVTLLEPGNSR